MQVCLCFSRRLISARTRSALACLALAALATTAVAAPTTRPASLTQLLTRFKAAATSREDRIRAGEQILALGRGGAARLLPAAKGRLAREKASYQRDFQGQAVRTRVAQTAAVAKKLGKTVGQLNAEMRAWRRAVMSLHNKATTTPAMLARQAGPALTKLAEMLNVTRDAVLAGSEDLRRRRAHVLALDGLVRACEQALGRSGATPAPGVKRAARPGTEQPARHDRGKAAHDRALPAPFAPPPDPPAGGLDLALWDAEQLATVLAIPMNPNSRRVLLRNAQLAAKIQPEEAVGIRHANRIRLLVGLWALQTDIRLCACSRDHNKDMIRRRFIGHVSPIAGKRQPWDRAKQFGTRAGGENISVGPTNAYKANYNWCHSPHHFLNFFHEFKRIGLGHTNGYWTQMLGW